MYTAGAYRSLVFAVASTSPWQSLLAQLVRARDCQSRGRRFDSGKNSKTENSNLHVFEVHRPSNKGTKLLLQVIKAIINQSFGPLSLLLWMLVAIKSSCRPARRKHGDCATSRILAWLWAIQSRLSLIQSPWIVGSFWVRNPLLERLFCESDGLFCRSPGPSRSLPFVGKLVLRGLHMSYGNWNCSTILSQLV